MAKLQKYRISPTTWAKAQDLVITRPDIPIKAIAEKVGIPYELLQEKASSTGWLSLRDIADIDRTTEKISHVIRDVAFQVNDFHEHTSAMIEALQNAYRVQIVRDSMGHIHYQNMPPVWPGRPDNYAQLSYEDQQKQLNTIDTRRLQGFINDMMSILSMKASNINFVTKMLKGALPKVDPIALDISRRDADPTVTAPTLDIDDPQTDTEEFDQVKLQEQLSDFQKKREELQDKITTILGEAKGE